MGPRLPQLSLRFTWGYQYAAATRLGAIGQSKGKRSEQSLDTGCRLLPRPDDNAGFEPRTLDLRSCYEFREEDKSLSLQTDLRWFLRSLNYRVVRLTARSAEEQL